MATRRCPVERTTPRQGWSRLLLSVALGLGLACATTPAPQPPVETGQLFLWSVERADGAGGTAHLFGTVHLSQEALHFDAAVEQALADAETLVLEVDPKELEPASMQALAAEVGIFQDGRRLDEVLGPETWALFSRHVASRGVPVSGFQGFEPWFALLTVQMLSLTRQGFDPAQGAETGLVGQAGDLGKPTRGLETAARQLEALDSLPMDLQVHMLRTFLEESEQGAAGDGGNAIALLIDAWRKGDADRLEAEIFDGLARDPSLAPYYEELYTRRNYEMADAIADFVDEGGRWFVAVGAAHMVGAEGVPNLLAAQGYRVERIAKTPH